MKKITRNTKIKCKKQEARSHGDKRDSFNSKCREIPLKEKKTSEKNKKKSI